MPTRYAKTPTDEISPTRYLASDQLRGLNIGLNVLAITARIRTQRERAAMFWLVNYALNVAKLTTVQLLNKFDEPYIVQVSVGIKVELPREGLALDKDYVRSALINPAEDLREFVGAVEDYRRRFESSLPELVDTEVSRIVARAFRRAQVKTAMIELLGKNRMGKSDCLRMHWLRNLDTVLWYECPGANDDLTFKCELARKIGVCASGAKKSGQIASQIKPCFGPQGIRTLIVDEAHRLWPADIRNKPLRIEFERELYADGGGCSIINVATHQFTASLNQMLANSVRWAPGQYQGRVTPYHLPDTMKDGDLARIARHYCKNIEDKAVEALILSAKSTEGYCGLMVNVLEEAELEAKGSTITEDLVLDTIDAFTRGTDLDQKTKALQLGVKPNRRGRRQ
jgi:hypothetical protein